MSSGPTKQLEAAIDQDRTGEKDDESRAELLASRLAYSGDYLCMCNRREQAATSLFNSASSESTVEQQAAEAPPSCSRFSCVALCNSVVATRMLYA